MPQKACRDRSNTFSFKNRIILAVLVHAFDIKFIIDRKQIRENKSIQINYL